MSRRSIVGYLLMIAAIACVAIKVATGAHLEVPAGIAVAVGLLLSLAQFAAAAPGDVPLYDVIARWALALLAAGSLGASISSGAVAVPEIGGGGAWQIPAAPDPGPRDGAVRDQDAQDAQGQADQLVGADGPLAWIGAAIFSPIGCSAPQVAAWVSLARCLLGCGVEDAGRLVESEAGGGQSVDASLIGWDALLCALPCAGSSGDAVLSGLRAGDDAPRAHKAPRSASRADLYGVCGSGDVPLCTIRVPGRSARDPAVR